MTAILMDEAALRKRIYKLHSGMQSAAKPRLWKNGRNKGHVRTPGLDHLPFTKEQLWDHVVAQVGFGAIRCSYCVIVGRPANIIDLTNCVIDHHVPKARAGMELSLVEIWSLQNLRADVCADCNALKGSLTYPCFVELISWVEAMRDEKDATYIRRCLRTHGRVMQGYKDKNKRPPSNDVIPVSGRLALAEDF